jgi:hypothetical protein
MVQVIVAHHVADYDRWYPEFTEHGAVRKAHGATGHVVTRGVEDANQLVIVITFGSLEGARGFMADPSLPEVMTRAGVDGPPTIYLVNPAERVRY